MNYIDEPTIPEKTSIFFFFIIQHFSIHFYNNSYRSCHFYPRGPFISCQVLNPYVTFEDGTNSVLCYSAVKGLILCRPYTKAQLRSKICNATSFWNVAGKSRSSMNWPVAARYRSADGVACDPAWHVTSGWFKNLMYVTNTDWSLTASLIALHSTRTHGHFPPRSHSTAVSLPRTHFVTQAPFVIAMSATVASNSLSLSAFIL